MKSKLKHRNFSIWLEAGGRNPDEGRNVWREITEDFKEPPVQGRDLLPKEKNVLQD